MSEKQDLILTIALVLVLVAVVCIVAYHVAGMIDDHNCFMDDYRSPHCAKYIRGE